MATFQIYAKSVATFTGILGIGYTVKYINTLESSLETAEIVMKDSNKKIDVLKHDNKLLREQIHYNTIIQLEKEKEANQNAQTEIIKTLGVTSVVIGVTGLVGMQVFKAMA